MKSSVKKIASKRPAPKPVKATPAQTFANLWQKVQKAKGSLNTLTLKQQAIMQQYHQDILPEETRYLEAYFDEMEHLMRFAFSPSLSERDQDWLHNYIQAGLVELCSFPFALSRDPKGVLMDWLSQLHAHFQDPEAEDDEAASLLDSIIEEFTAYQQAQRDDSEAPFNEDAQADGPAFDEDKEEDSWRYSEAPSAADAPADSLFDSGLINKLFRHLAKRLHPDLAANEDEKAHKHELMTQLLQARDQQDLATLLDLYASYGQADGLLLDDMQYSQFARVLKRQLAEVNAEKNQLQYDGLQGVIFRRFYRRGAVAQKAIWQNERSLLQQQQQFSRERITRVKSVAALKKEIKAMRSAQAAYWGF